MDENLLLAKAIISALNRFFPESIAMLAINYKNLDIKILYKYVQAESRKLVDSNSGNVS